jgi:hypothetical protein
MSVYIYMAVQIYKKDIDRWVTAETLIFRNKLKLRRLLLNESFPKGLPEDFPMLFGEHFLFTPKRLNTTLFNMCFMGEHGFSWVLLEDLTPVVLDTPKRLQDVHDAYRAYGLDKVRLVFGFED